MAVSFSDRMQSVKGSEIRELLKITQRPEVISFAGGLPAPELFPVEEMKRISVEVLEEAGCQALQYSTTEGFDPLRRQISHRMNDKFKTDVNWENILITSGSQQGLDFSGKLFLNQGDVVLVESPTYLAALSAFAAYGAKFAEVPTDDDGMIIGELEKILETTPNVKLVYIVPDFQNPTGRTWSPARREELIKVINKYEIPLVEDNPYGELIFEGEILPSVKSFDTKGLVIYLGTFSKTFCPGLRVGWVAADQKFLDKYVLLKQAADLHSSSLSQREISKYMELYDFEERIRNITDFYKKRRDAMLQAIEKHFGPDVKITRPRGGLFIWAEAPEHINTVELLKLCLENNVAFVPGDSFFPGRKVKNAFRLNFSNMPEDRIEEGIRRIAETMKNGKWKAESGK